MSGQFYSGVTVMKIIAVFLFSMIAGIALHAQHTDPQQQRVERAYEQFKQQMNEEFGEEPDGGQKNDAVSIVGFQKTVALPAWLFEPEDTDSYMLSAIAASDPRSDSTLAGRQALLRALALIALSHGCNIQNISDNYYFDQAGKKTLGKFNSFTSIGAEMSYDSALLQVRGFEYTGNGEAIIMIALPAHPSGGSCNIKCNIEIFQSETGKTSMSHLITKLNVNIIHTGADGKKDVASWQLNESVLGIEVVSEMNGVPLEQPAQKFRYTGQGQPEGDTLAGQVFPFDLKYGFWYGYISSLGSQLEQLDVFNSRVKYLDDNFYHQYQDLTRVISSNTIGFKLNRVSISGNKISLGLTKN